MNLEFTEFKEQVNDFIEDVLADISFKRAESSSDKVWAKAATAKTNRNKIVTTRFISFNQFLVRK